MRILGISAFYHDSAAVILEDGNILAAAQEERFTRKKHDPSFPINAVKYCIQESGFSIAKLDAVVFYDKPLLKFERLLETYYNFAPKGLRSFLSAMPVWMKEKMLLKKLILDELSKIEKFDKKSLSLLFPEHHLSHAASAFFVSPFKEAAILTIDGVGEWATAAIFHGTDNKIEVLKEIRFPHSLGLLYSAFTSFLGFRVNSGEYKMMGLAPYGNPESEETQEYIELIKSELVDIKEDGSIWLNQSYFNYATGLTMINEKKWAQLFGFPRREAETELDQKYCDIAYAIQSVTEEIVLKMASEAKSLTGSQNLCLAGGVTLNCVANGKLVESGLFESIFIQPAAGDAGGALGAALATHHIYFGGERVYPTGMDTMQGAYLGPKFSDAETESTLKKYKARYRKYTSEEEMLNKVVGLIENGNVIGWYQGRMEFGPRALGNRSILGDARSPEMQKKLNLKIKYRESFRPFAPSAIIEDTPNLFDMTVGSPYMLLVTQVKKHLQNPLPPGYSTMPLKEKLYFERSKIPAITHLNFSARVQTVHKETNPLYWALINKFKENTGYGVIVNTSFNVRGEPIVCTPEDAYRCFMRTEMDYLVMGNYFLSKKDQTETPAELDWQEEFPLD